MPSYAKAEDRDAYLRGRWTARSAAAGSSGLRTRYAPAIVMLLGIVACVLLVACANIATLQLARISARAHELSVRIALGAPRRRIVAQLLLESLLLSSCGAVTVTTAALFGTIPALRASHAQPVDALKRHRLGEGAGMRASSVLVIVQVALSVVLVVGAAVFLRSFVALAYRDLGFDRSRLLIAIVDARRATGPGERRVALSDRLREAADQAR